MKLFLGIMIAAATVGASVFDNIRENDIAAWPMNGDALEVMGDEEPMLPPGSIVVYRTSDGLYGKYFFTEVGTSLGLFAVTFGPDSLAFEGALIVPATRYIDFDNGMIQTIPNANTDFRWNVSWRPNGQMLPYGDVVHAFWGANSADESTWSNIKAMY